MLDVGLACRSCINRNLITEIKNTESQLILHIECVKGNFNFLFKGAFLRVRLLAQNDGFDFKQKNLEIVNLQLFCVLELLDHKSLYSLCIFAESSIKQNKALLTYYCRPTEK